MRVLVKCVVKADKVCGASWQSVWCKLTKAASETVVGFFYFKVGQNHIYAVYIRYFWQGNHQIYGVYIRIYTVLANPIYFISAGCWR